MKKTVALLATAFIISGCTTTSGLDATTSVASFDGARVVNIVPHAAMATGHSDYISIGGQWSSATPAMSSMQVKLTSYTGYSLIDRAILKIDGQDVELNKASASTQFNKMDQFPIYYSTASFSTPIATFERIAAAKDVRIRVYTPRGYVDDIILSPEKDSKAFNAVKRFLKSVHTEKATQSKL